MRGRSLLDHARETFDGPGPVIAATMNGQRSITVTTPPRRARDRARPGRALLAAASVLLLALAVAQGYVSFTAQRTFVLAARHAGLPSTLEALGLDCGAVIFALLGLAQARMGRPARVERALNVTAALGSAAMNLLAGNMGSPRSVAVYLLPPLLYAAGSDRLIAVVGSAAGVGETSVWRVAGRVAMYAGRFVLAAPSTARGLRLWLLASTPLPAAADQAAVTAGSPAGVLPPGVTPDATGGGQAAPVAAAKAGRPTKRARLIELYEELGRAGDARIGDRARAAELAAELAPRIDLDQGTARTYLYAYLRERAA